MSLPRQSLQGSIARWKSSQRIPSCRMLEGPNGGDFHPSHRRRTYPLEDCLIRPDHREPSDYTLTKLYRANHRIRYIFQRRNLPLWSMSHLEPKLDYLRRQGSRVGEAQRNSRGEDEEIASQANLERIHHATMIMSIRAMMKTNTYTALNAKLSSSPCSPVVKFRISPWPV